MTWPATSVEMHAVADAVERDLRSLLLGEERLIHRRALDGVAERPQEPPRIDLTLDEEVLGTQLERARGEGVVIETGEHHQRDSRSYCLHPLDRVQALGIRQTEVQQHDVDAVVGEVQLRLPHRRDVRQLGTERVLAAEHLADQPGIARVVLHDQQQLPCHGDAHRVARDGSRALTSQKSLMLSTMPMNTSSSTGFVR